MTKRVNIQSLLFLALTVSAAAMLRTEASAFRAVQSPNAAAVHYIETLPKSPFSLQAVHRVLMKCDGVLALPIASLQPKKRRKTTAKVCAEFAKQVLVDVPTHGFAYLTLARTAETPEFLAQHLNTSFRFAPFEGWLAERRFVLGINAGLLAPHVLSKDSATLLTTGSGAELLANYYLRRPQTHNLISGALDQALAADRNRFLKLLETTKVSR